MEGFERACGGSQERALQSRKVSAAQNVEFSGKRIIAIKSYNILPYFGANLCLCRALPLSASMKICRKADYYGSRSKCRQTGLQVCR